MLRFRFASIGLISLLACQCAVAEIYKTVDKEGRVTYSDVPPPKGNVKPIELKTINTTPPPSDMPIRLSPNNTQQQANQTYEVLMTAPANGTTLMVNERSVTMSINLNQGLQEGDALVYKIDGNELIKTTELSFTLEEPPRGEHSLSVEVIDSEGNILAQSDTTTIMVMRPLPKQEVTPVPKK